MLKREREILGQVKALNRRQIAFRVLSCIVSVSLTACAGPAVDPGSRQPPRLSLSKTEHDFGRVEQGAVVRHGFTLTNRGGRDLQIVRLRTADDTTARVASREVAGGASQTIEVAFDTAAVAGSERRTVTLYTNDSERPVTVLSLAGEVVLQAVAQPPALYVGTVRAGQRTRQDLQIRAAEGVRIESVVTDGPYLEVAASPLENGAPGWAVAISIAPTAPLGPFDEQVQVRTSSQTRPSFAVPVHGRVGPGLEAAPARLSAAVLETLVENHREQPVELLAAEVVPASLGTASLETLRKGFRYRLKVAPGGEGSSAAGTVRITTDDARQPVLEVPFDPAVGAVGSEMGNGGE